MRERHDHAVVREDVGLLHAQLKVEDVQELALDPADVALPEDTRAQGPMDVLQGGVVQVLRENVA